MSGDGERFMIDGGLNESESISLATSRAAATFSECSSIDGPGDGIL